MIKVWTRFESSFVSYYPGKFCRKYEIGDCVPDEDIRKTPGIENQRYDTLARLDNYVETVPVKNTKPTLGNNGKAYSLQARYNILKNLPTFLMDFINQITQDPKRQVFFDIVNPIIFRCYKIMQISYGDSTYYSSQYSNKLKSSMDLYLIAGLPVSDIRAEFLRIIGRFYFLTSLKFSDKMKFDSSEEQRVISDFIEQFFSRTNIYDGELTDRIEDGEIQSFIADETRGTRGIEKDKIEKLKAIKNSFCGKFATRRERYQDDDPFVVFDYYCRRCIFDSSLRIFSKIERRFINSWVQYNEEYEQEATNLEHNDPLEYNKIPFKGKLLKSSSGKGIIELRDRYDKLEPWKGRNTLVLLDN